MNIKEAIATKTAEGIGLKVTGVGATVTVIGGLSLQELGIIVGIAVGVLGILIQIIFGTIRLHREHQEHKLHVEKTRLEIEELKNDGITVDIES